jgi:hypothetical protein
MLNKNSLFVGKFIGLNEHFRFMVSAFSDRSQFHPAVRDHSGLECLMVDPGTAASTSAPLDFENAPLYRTLVKTLSATETTRRGAAIQSAKNVPPITGHRDVVTHFQHG